MKILLVALNAKYYHTNPAIRILKNYINENIELAEHTINDDFDSILINIMSYKADLIGFSCYIWNIGIVLRLCECIKKIDENIKIVLGGPEVSYDPDTLMKENKYIDFIIMGEGEERLKKLIKAVEGYIFMDDIDGLAYKENGKIKINPVKYTVSLDDIGFCYENDEDLKGKMIYYETSRGCPFGCSYCISSLDRNVRYKNIEAIKNDFEKMARMDVKIVKLVDRSFNCNTERAYKILDIIRSLPGNTVFHCEINPELVDSEFISKLTGLKNRIQFEAGIQTTNPISLSEVGRKADASLGLKGIKLLREAGFKVHADLIAGLPFDDYQSFSRSFDDLYDTKPDEIQLGFLKLLKGTKIRASADLYGIVYSDEPPYEILKNRWMTFDELAKLKGITEIVDKYYNSGCFVNILNYVLKRFNRPFEFYEEFSDYLRTQKISLGNSSLTKLYSFLYKYLEHFDININFAKDLFKFDYMLTQKNKNLPDFLCHNVNKKDHNFIKKLISDKYWLEKNMSYYKNKGISEVLKIITYDRFNYNVPYEEKTENYYIFIHDDNERKYLKIKPVEDTDD